MTASSLAVGAVGGAALIDGSVQGVKLQDNSITPNKLVSDTPANGDVLSYNGVGFEWVTVAAASGGGESNTVSNVGAVGVGVYKQKVGVIWN